MSACYIPVFARYFQGLEFVIAAVLYCCMLAVLSIYFMAETLFVSILLKTSSTRKYLSKVQLTKLKHTLPDRQKFYMFVSIFDLSQASEDISCGSFSRPVIGCSKIACQTDK